MEEDLELPSYSTALTAGIKDSAIYNEGFEPDIAEVNGTGISSEGFEPDFDATLSPLTPLLNPRRGRIYMPNVGALTDEMIRNACYEYATDSCCYGRHFIRNMTMKDVTNSFTFSYSLESYCERREVVSKFSAFYGQTIDGPENGPEPDPWDIQVPVEVEFKDWQTKLELPHSAHVRQCGTCHGNRNVPCDSCYGNGSYTCFQCEGRGLDFEDDACTSCDGSGKRKCLLCSGTGLVECRVCDGYGRLKNYKMLIVTRTTHTDDFLSNSMNLPKYCILSLSGRIIFTEKGSRVLPLSSSPDRLVCEASRNLINRHSNAFPGELLVLQRHTLRAIPITRVIYSWRGSEGEFYIYGYKNRVYFERYPQQCCCVCM